MNETWKPVIDWFDFYEISDFGRVRSKIRKGQTNLGERLYGGKILTPIINSAGYLVVNLTKRGKREQRTVHSIV